MTRGALLQLQLILDGVRRRTAAQAAAGDCPPAWVKVLDELAAELAEDLAHTTDAAREAAKEKTR
jgi:hypothetical protein